MTHFLHFCREMDSGSNTVVPTLFAKVATPTMAQGQVMPIVVPISISLGESQRNLMTNFKRWQHKILFYLTILNLARFLIEDAPKFKEDEHDIKVIIAMDA